MIEEALRQQHENWVQVGFTNPLKLLVLEKGKVFKPAKFRGYGRRREPQACWSNAMMLAMSNPELEYVEGFGLSGKLASVGLVIDHAWCVTKDGKVVDPTWREPEKAQYMGVILPKAEAWRYVLDKGYYGVLNNYGGEMIDIKAIEHFFPEYEGRQWKE